MTVREIGSDFEWESPAPGAIPHVLPWETEPGFHVLTGRQALAAIAAELTERGIHSAWFPAYLCDSMVEAFSADFEISYVPVDELLWPSPEDIALLGAESAYLHAPYFGRSTPGPVREALHGAVDRGTVVIEDRTHSVLGSPAARFDAAQYSMASLRKLLPIPAGAWVTGVRRAPVRSDGLAVTLRREAMERKSANLASENPMKDHLELFAESEETLTAELAPAALPEEIVDMMRRFDYELIRERRRSNAAFLGHELSGMGIEVLNGDADVASHLVIVSNRRDELRIALAREGVYCPIHWRQHPEMPVRMREDLLSIPIDQRYTRPDMERIVSVMELLV